MRCILHKVVKAYKIPYVYEPNGVIEVYDLLSGHQDMNYKRYRHDPILRQVMVVPLKCQNLEVITSIYIDFTLF